MKRLSAMAAVDKIEEMRKPEDFVGHRNRASRKERRRWVSFLLSSSVGT